MISDGTFFSSLLTSTLFVTEWCLDQNCFTFVLQAASLPMSIIIVGIGNADFDGECDSR